MNTSGCPLILAQDNQPFTVPGAGGGEGEGLQGAGNGQPPADPLGGSSSAFFLIILLMVGAMIVFSMMAQRRDRKKRDAMLSALKKHDKVQTIGGVIGSVVDLKKDVVVLKIDESSNTRMTIARSAVQQILSASDRAADAPAAGEEKA